MQFLQSSILRSQKILSCVPLQRESVRYGTCGILIIRHDYAQVLNVDNTHEQVVLSAQAMYPLSVPIVWCCVIGTHIAAVTRDGHLLMLESSPPFARVSAHELTTDFCPATIPVAHCVASRHDEFMVTCGFTGNVVVGQFDPNDKPDLSFASLPDFFVFGVAATEDPRLFAFLVASPGGRKYVIVFDVDEKVEQNRWEVPRDAVTIDSLFDDDGYSKLVLFTETELRIGDISKTGAVLKSQICSWFVTGMGELIVQCVNNCMYGVSTVSEVPTLIDKGVLPLCSSFCSLSNNLLLCISETGDSFFLPITFSSTRSYVNDRNTVAFELLLKTSIPLTPRVTSALFNDRALMVASGGGETSQFAVSMYYNSLPFSVVKMESASTAVKRLGNGVKLFSLPSDVLVASSPEGTIVLSGLMNVVNEETFALDTFGDDIIQIHRRGIRKLVEGKDWIGGRVIGGSVGDNACVVAFDDSVVRLFDENLDMLVERVVPGVYAVAFCSNSLAIATGSTAGGNSTVTLYSRDLMPTDDIGQLTGDADSMLFAPETNELVVSTVNGSVTRWIIDNDFSNSCAEIYGSKSPSILCLFKDYILISSDIVYLYDGTQLLCVNIPNVTAVCCACEPDEIYVMDDNQDIYIANIPESDRDLTPKTALCDAVPRKMVSVGNRTFVITRSKRNDEFVSAVIEIEDDGESDDINRAITVFPIHLGAVSILAAPHNFLLVGFVTSTNTGFLLVVKITGERLVGKESFDLPEPPLSMTLWRDKVLVGTGRKVEVLELDAQSQVWSISSNIVHALPTQVAFIEARDQFLWVADRTQSIICFAGDTTLEIVAVDPNPRQLTAMCVMSDTTIAVGDKFGVIAILGLPRDIVHGEPWRKSRTIDRGTANTVAASLVKLAVFSIHDTVTSLMMSRRSRALFYTTLLGQVGFMIALEDEAEFMMLENTELLTKRLCAKEFGLTLLPRFSAERMNVVSADVLDLIEQLQPESQDAIKGVIRMPTQALVGRLCRLKHLAKF